VTACVGIQTNEKVDLNIDHMIDAFVCLFVVNDYQKHKQVFRNSSQHIICVLISGCIQKAIDVEFQKCVKFS
jgi:hypothetical protein